ncbi:MAG: Eco57I restriction-modification methylase domain-containing protein, partial [Planctomycetaceae bacterium]|nr:Eco57I restriction-modification methylase domain-containing protein [Planctomycetaceae bacterium]
LTLSTPERDCPPAPGRFGAGDALLGPAFGQNGDGPAATGPAAVGVVDWSRMFPSALAADGFDAVIGNPPYEVLTNFARHPERRELAEALRHSGYYHDALGRQINLYRCFIERSLQVLAPGGILAFVVPMSLARDRAAAPIRERLLRREGAGEWTFFSERDRLFPGVTQSLCIFSATRSAGPVAEVTLITDGVPHSLPAASLDDEFRLPALDSDGIRLYRWLHDHCPGRIGDVADMRVGEVDQTVYRECMADDDTGCFLARGCHLRPFVLDVSGGGEQRYLRLDRFLAMKGATGPACRDRAARPRVVQLGIRNLQSRPRLVAAIAPPGVYLGNSLNVYFPKENVDSRFLAGMLNSRLLDWLFSATSGNNNINLYEIARLPFPARCARDRAAAVAEAYDRCVAAALSGEGVDTVRRELDAAVAACYGIPEEMAVPTSW